MKRAQPSFEALLEPLYASLVDPARFADFAAALRTAVDSHLVALQTDDGTHRHRVYRHFSQAVPDVPDSVPSADDSSVNQYMLRGANDLVRKGVINSARLFPRNDLERTAFYEEVLAPIDVFHSAGVLLATDGSSIVGLSVSRSRSRRPFDAQDESLLRRLMPHLQNVYLLQVKMQRAQHLMQALDALTHAAWIVNVDGEMIYANKPAQVMMADDGGCIRMRDRRLFATWKWDRSTLFQAIQRSVHGGDGRGRMLLRDATGRLQATCTLHPLLQGSFDGWMIPNHPAALLLAAPLEVPVTVSSELLRQAYGLTAAEALLARSLLQVGSLAGCHRVLNKSPETLRTQLKALFVKTGTHRQSELLLTLRELSS